MRTLAPTILAVTGFLALSAKPALSQAVFVPSAAELSPSFSSGASNYSPDTGVNCPTPTFNITAFGRGTNGWTDNHFDPYQASTGGVGNYGGAIGFSYPFGGKLREFCTKLAEERTKFEQVRVQADLLNKCRYLVFDLGVTVEMFDENKDMFQKDGPLSAFAECKSIRALLDPAKTKPNLSISKSPEKESERFSPKPPATYNVNPR